MIDVVLDGVLYVSHQFKIAIYGRLVPGRGKGFNVECFFLGRFLNKWMRELFFCFLGSEKCDDADPAFYLVEEPPVSERICSKLEAIFCFFGDDRRGFAGAFVVSYHSAVDQVHTADQWDIEVVEIELELIFDVGGLDHGGDPFLIPP